MRTILVAVLACLVVQPALGAALDAPYMSASEKDMQWWRDARFGIFIHWGPASLTGQEISFARGGKRPGFAEPWASQRGPVPQEVYDNLYKQFNPTRFDADAWAKLAKEAGMKYVIFTTKHCDGFCNWNTQLTGYNIMNSPFKRDICAELAQACRRNGLRIGWYYSCLDWYDPDFLTASHAKYIEYMRGQIRELCSKYGKISVLWFDVGGPPDRYDADNLVKMIRKLQPGILINNRLGPPGDFDTPEQAIGGFNTSRPWESCITLQDQWSYNPNAIVKSVDECIRTLVRCACGDGNLLLNVGPMPTGEIDATQTARLKGIGAWLRRYSKSICGTRGGPFMSGSWAAALAGETSSTCTSWTNGGTGSKCPQSP